MEENKNTISPIQMLVDSVNSFNSFVEEEKAKRQKQYTQTTQNSTRNIYSIWVNSGDNKIKTECNQTVRLQQAADWINAKFDGGKKVLWTWELLPYVQGYIDENKNNQYWRAMFDYVINGNEDCNPASFYESMWTSVTPNTVKEQEKDMWDTDWGWFLNWEWNTVSNVIWGALNTASWPWELIESGLDRLIGSIYDVFAWEWASDDWIQNQEAIRDSINLPWSDPESVVYNTTNFLTDMWALAALDYLFPQVWIPLTAEKYWKRVKKYPELEKAAKTIYTWTKWNEKTQKALKWLIKQWARWLKWAKDMFILDTLDWESPSLSSEWRWAIFNVVLWLWKNKVDKNTVKWLLDKETAKGMIKILKDKYWLDLNLSQIWDFINRRFSWTKKQIAKQAEAWAKAAVELKDYLLSLSEDKIESETTTSVLKFLREKFRWWLKPWEKESNKIKENIVEEIDNLIKWDNKYTLSEMNKIIRDYVDKYIKLFEDWKVSEVTESANPWTQTVLDTVRWWRREIVDLVNSNAEKLWLWDIAALNKEIQVWKTLEESLGDDVIKEWVKETKWTLSKIAETTQYLWWLWGYAIGDMKWAAVWILLGLAPKVFDKLLSNRTVKSLIARTINTMSWEWKKNLSDWIMSNWKKALDESWKKDLIDLIEKTWPSTMTKILETLGYTLTEKTEESILD